MGLGCGYDLLAPDDCYLRISPKKGSEGHRDSRTLARSQICKRISLPIASLGVLRQAAKLSGNCNSEIEMTHGDHAETYRRRA